MSNLQLDNLPLEWIRAFEAAGRTGSFTAAAAETGLTQSAISQRIGNLERQIGTALFLRQARGVILTVDGETWLPYVSSALISLRRSSEALFGVQRKHLTISATASVIELWIAERLQQIPAQEHIQISFKSMVLASDVTQQDDIIKVRYGGGDWPQHYKVPLYKEEISPVAAPGLLQTPKPWQTLPRLNLSGPRPGWKDWADQTGDPVTPVPMFRFDAFSSALAAARAGLGVVLASLPLCQEDLQSGRLVRLSQDSLTTRDTNWLLASKESLSQRQWSMLSKTLTRPG
ncbi:LysR family transcriptional regulator [Parasedimentitalea psychrophila]|uniref:LysR family transcriptional regulator n=1 Tax=Parasedimentitalea psychrophila TaxID=2997337 RepID=A0A9Y2KZ62_9RHOB|nr:LysR family transcriptional regulator [Parasedimentitalea psychrophila]WIY23869.1 LysR family transcriptional regulator [Parasedimentitalea psychrophila]